MPFTVTETQASSALPDGWTDLDSRAVDTIRVLAADAVQKVGNGHPGTAMSLAPVAYLLFNKVMRHNPADPHWPGRDRFVLSCGHSSLTLYIQLYLGGFGLELDDLKSLRTWNSKTPGHPEYGHTPGVEITTGPLGQGIANAVGMSMASRRERGLLDPDAAPGESIFDHQIYCLASDGDIEEGISSEASSLAGTQRLGNLTLIYDSNRISIEDDTNIALTEDTAARYAAYGWHVQTVDWTNGDTQYEENVTALLDAIEAAKAVTDQPSFIELRTIIAWPAPKLQGTGKSHGSALGGDEVAATKKVLGFDPDQTFEVSDEVIAHTRKLLERGQQAQDEWEIACNSWAEANPEGKALYDRFVTNELSPGWDDALPSWDADPKGIATRAASGKVLSAIAPKMPELWGGSADLAESNNTTPEGEPSFLPEDRQTKAWPGNPYGRVLHFGIREHAMGAILNGIKAHGGTRPYGGTFLTFSDYMRGAVRLSALMRLPVVYVWTHDSIGLGEDGPTHQPIEHIAALRVIPGLDVVRPSDANETAACWAAILRPQGPPGRAAAEPAEPADRASRPGRLRRELRGRQGRLHPQGRRRHAGRDLDRHRIRGAVRGRRAGTVGRRGHRRPGRFDALPRMVRRAGPGLPRFGDPARHQGSSERRGRREHGLARRGGRPRPHSQHQPVRSQRGGGQAVRGVRLHRRQGGRGREGEHRRRGVHPVADPPGARGTERPRRPRRPPQRHYQLTRSAEQIHRRSRRN